MRAVTWILLPVLLPVFCGPGLRAQERAASPRIEELRARVAADGGGATRAFWEQVEASGTPLVASTDDGRLRVTFLWRGTSEVGPIAVFSAATGWTQPGHLLELMPGTDVWYGTFLVPADARFTYRVSLNDNLRTYYRDPDWRGRAARFRSDPFNPDTVALGGGAVASVFEGPEALTSDLVDPAANDPRPQVVDMTIPSDALSADRQVLVYVPSLPRTPSPTPLPLLVVLDGDRYTSTAPTPTILQNLTAQGRLPPVVAAFVKQRDRTRELSADTAFTRFLARELVPALQDRFGAGLDPELTTIAGSSLGGLAAAYAGLTYPHVFGAVLAQSGSFWWAPPASPEPGWLMRAYAHRPRAPVRFYLEVGRLEREPVRGGPTMLDLSRHMRDVLCAKGYSVWYRETGGDHSYVSWRHSLGTALESILLPSGTPSAEGLAPACVEPAR